MTAIADPPAAQPAKSSKMPLLIGLILALFGAGGGFMAVQMGFIGGDAGAQSTDDGHETAVGDHGEPLGEVAFVALEPLIISLPGDNGPRFLRFTAQLEVQPDYQADVIAVQPRIVDVLNGYLRAVDITELENPTALVRLRGQMLRRIQVVVGDGRVKDLLIMEFVVN